MKLLIVDGSSLLNTHFWATVPREYMMAKTYEEKQCHAKRILQTSGGIFTNGAYSMLKAILKLINDQKPSHMAVAWDVTRDTFRRKLFAEYKAQRHEQLPELKEQFGIMQEILAAAGIPQFMSEEYEADDYMGSLAMQYESQIPVFLLTKDRDALQLVSHRTRLWLLSSHCGEWSKEYGVRQTGPEGAFEFTPSLVEEVFGIRPDQIAELKALQGDPSDNIPGVHGVGEKSAVPLLQEYGTIEAIFEAIEDQVSFKAVCKQIGIKSPLTALQKGKENAFLSRTLATIKTDIPVEDDLAALELCMNNLGLEECCRKYEFRYVYGTPKIKPKDSAVQTSLDL